jgi:excisionase family DNA binding protein
MERAEEMPRVLQRRCTERVEAMTERTHLTQKQVAERLIVSAEHVGDLIRAGLLRASNVGLGSRPQWRISLVDLDAFLAARINKPIEPVELPKLQRLQRRRPIRPNGSIEEWV